MDKYVALKRYRYELGDVVRALDRMVLDEKPITEYDIDLICKKVKYATDELLLKIR